MRIVLTVLNLEFSPMILATIEAISLASLFRPSCVEAFRLLFTRPTTRTSLLVVISTVFTWAPIVLMTTAWILPSVSALTAEGFVCVAAGIVSAINSKPATRLNARICLAIDRYSKGIHNRPIYLRGHKGIERDQPRWRCFTACQLMH